MKTVLFKVYRETRQKYNLFVQGMCKVCMKEFKDNQKVVIISDDVHNALEHLNCNQKKNG